MKKISLDLLFLILLVSFIGTSMIETSHAFNYDNGWILPTVTGDHVKYVGYGDHYSPGGLASVHLGQDFESNSGDPVYAIADGEVIESRTNVGGYGPGGSRGGALVALFKTSDGVEFKALYGHINSPHSKGAIKAGDVLGYVNSYNPSHLHFGINPGRDYPSDGNPWRGYVKATDYANGVTYGWVDPIEFMETHTPYNAAAATSSVTTPQDQSSESQTNQQSETNTNEAEFWAQKGYELENQKRWDEALQALDRSIELNPNNSEVWRNKGVALYFLDRYDEAIQATEKAIEVDPRNTNAVNQRDQFIRDSARYSGNQDTSDHTGTDVSPETQQSSQTTTLPDPQPHPGFPDGTLELYAHDANTGSLLSGVRISVQDSEGNGRISITDAAGFAAFTAQPGTWQYTATKDGYYSASGSFEVTTTVAKNIYLTPM